MNPVLALIITNIIWGGASPIFKFALLNIPPFTLAFIRFFFAGLLLLPWAIKKWQRLSGKQWLEMAVVAFIGITLHISFFFLGITRTESINAPIIASSAPIFIYLGSLVFLKERPRIRVLSGMLAALVGVLVIIFAPIFLDGQTWVFGEVEGNLFILVSTLCVVIQTLIGHNLLKKVNFVQVSALTFLIGAAGFLPFVPKELAVWNFSYLNINGVVGIIYGVFFSSALAYSLFYYGISRLKAQEIGLFSYIDPLAAVVIAIPLLHEYPNLYYFIGSILVFGGIYFAEGRLHWHPFHKLKNHRVLK